MAYSKQNFQDGQILNAANLEAMENGIIAGQGARNLLDNSDFRIKENIINTKGLTKYELDDGPVIDRWRLHWSGNDCKLEIKNGYIELYRPDHSIYLFQHPRNLQSMVGKTYTVAAKLQGNGYIGWIDSTQRVNSGAQSLSDWSIITCTFTVGSATCEWGEAGIEIATTMNQSLNIQWVALYEGVYDKYTIPDYVPKSPKVELLNSESDFLPKNLLFNSDFTNPINSQGKTVYTGSANGDIETIDKWLFSWQVNGRIEISNGYITKGSGENSAILQLMPKEKFNLSKVHTIAMKIGSGDLYVYSGKLTDGIGDWGKTIWCTYDSGADWVYFRIESGFSGTILWCALYEGEYSKTTLPPYIHQNKKIERMTHNEINKNYLSNSDFRVWNANNPISNCNVDTVFAANWLGSGNQIRKYEKTKEGLLMTRQGEAMYYFGIQQRIPDYKIEPGIYTAVWEIKTSETCRTANSRRIIPAGQKTRDFFKIEITQNYLNTYNYQDINFVIQDLVDGSTLPDNFSLFIYNTALYKGALSEEEIPVYKNEDITEELYHSAPLYPRNLLYNSNFAEPINNRGQMSYSSLTIPAIDGWITQYDTNLSIEAGHINLTGSWDMRQYFDNPKDGVYTFAIKVRVNSIGDTHIPSFGLAGQENPFSGNIGIWKILTVYKDLSAVSDEIIEAMIGCRGGNLSIQWAVVFKGYYTADMLESYSPEPRAVEMIKAHVPLSPRNLIKNGNFDKGAFLTQRFLNNYINDVIWLGYEWHGNTSVSADGTDYGIRLSSSEQYGYIYQKVNLIPGRCYTCIVRPAQISAAHRVAIFDSTLSTIWTDKIVQTRIDGTIVVPFIAGASQACIVYYPGFTEGGGWSILKSIELYEGDYHYSALPAYVPNQKRIELLDCAVPVQPINLLDNSNFKDPYNQKGVASGSTVTGWGFFMDRWCFRADSGVINFTPEGINASAAIGQGLDPNKVKTGLMYTAAAKWYDGTICVASGIIQRTDTWHSWSSETINGHNLYVSDEGNGNTACITISSGLIEWAALYEGTYTLETLPPYVPKDRSVEKHACEQFFYRVTSPGLGVFGQGYAVSSTAAMIVVKAPRMRTFAPTFSYSSGLYVRDFIGTESSLDATGVSVTPYGWTDDSLLLYITGLSGLTVRNPYLLQQKNTSAYIQFSAEV